MQALENPDIAAHLVSGIRAKLDLFALARACIAPSRDHKVLSQLPILMEGRPSKVIFYYGMCQL
ncbi:hypothetical protein PRCB_10870 [Pantoea rodasii]|uniref:Uncharacterized protein n=1 Tax=Pantoea rodasii TaxID=1076549 RepID=A0A2M9WDE2_9GAMM|nr:hypothetical protein HA45_20525 [Pantoea rodasii]PJZ05537.1 hypothetical protein PRCB_10870 [Pantoea rodasii]